MFPTALIPSADGFEEIELVSIVDILRRAQVSVTLASITSSLTIKGGHGISLICDKLLKDCENIHWDLIALAGGTANAEALSESQLLLQMLRKQKQNNNWYASICASPALVFEAKGLLEGEKATCYPKYFEKLKEKAVKNPVVVSNKCITGQAPGNSVEFALMLVEKLVGKKEAMDVAKVLVFKRK